MENMNVFSQHNMILEVKEEKMICNKWREIKQLNVKNGLVYFKK